MVHPCTGKRLCGSWEDGWCIYHKPLDCPAYAELVKYQVRRLARLKAAIEPLRGWHGLPLIYRQEHAALIEVLDGAREMPPPARPKLEKVAAEVRDALQDLAMEQEPTTLHSVHGWLCELGAKLDVALGEEAEPQPPTSKELAGDDYDGHCVGCGMYLGDALTCPECGA